MESDSDNWRTWTIMDRHVWIGNDESDTFVYNIKI